MTLVKARKLRGEQSDAEQKLRSALRDHRLGALKFRRQVPIGSYVADFCCLSRRLVIEIDGRFHDDEKTSEHDFRRENFLRARGFEVLRFGSGDVVRNRDKVVRRILEALRHD